MLPDLPLGPLPFKGYGLMIGLGIVLCFVLVIHEARRTGLKILEERVGTFFLVIAGSAWFGGKAMFLLLHGDEAARLWREQGPGSLVGAGFVFYGALLVAVPAGILTIRRWRLPLLETTDLLMPVVPVAHAMGRLGCFLAGCCYGCRTDGPLGVTFTKGQGLNGVPLHPTQLYEAAGNALIFLVLWRGPRLRPLFPGHLTLVYLMLYAVLRFSIEFIRGDGNPVWLGDAGPRAPGDAPGGITAGQVTSLALGFGAAALYLAARRRRAAA